MVYLKLTCRKSCPGYFGQRWVASWDAPPTQAFEVRGRTELPPAFASAQRSQAWARAPKPQQTIETRAQMARKSMRAGHQRLKSNLFLLGPCARPFCQQKGQAQSPSTHKVGDGSRCRMSSRARKGYLTNANLPIFSCTWGGLSMQQVCIQILCAQTQPSPFEILAPNASGFCWNSWSLGMRGCKWGESLSAAPRSPSHFHRARKHMQARQRLKFGVWSPLFKSWIRKGHLCSLDCMQVSCRGLQTKGKM